MLVWKNLMTPQITPNQLCTVTLLGNLVSKPEIRYTVNPVMAITEITLATHTKWLDKASNKYKEWTSYHHVRVIGPLVEQTLLHAQKGDLILVNGHLSDKPSKKNVNADKIITASFVQDFSKGYSQSINQIYCSATLSSDIQLLTTENNKALVQVDISITWQEYSISKEKMQQKSIERKLHVWGKQAVMLNEKAKSGDTIVIEGKLSYSTYANKEQFIEGKNIHLFKN